ncbi:MAG: DUF58 domain-containing protein [Chloroflexi bacterium]|nr:DUF58 domain-containing protein [Chloroflexota bacterium]
MFNDTWIALAVFFGLLGVLFRQESLVIMSTVLLTVIAVAWLWNRYALRGVLYRRQLSERRAFVGEEVMLSIQVTNGKLLPVAWLKAEDELPTALPLIGDRLAPSHKETVGYLVNLYSLRWRERVTRRFRLSCAQRGFYALGPVRMQASDVFGLFSAAVVDEREDTLIVYPQVLPLEAWNLPPKDPFGNAKAEEPLFADPSRAVGVRDHQPYDGQKHIHWKASARQQRLQVKVYEPTTSPQWIIFLNVNTLPEPLQGSDPVLLEQIVSLAASVASFGVEQKYMVGLVANGSLPRSDQPLKVLPSRSPDHLMHMLEALAAVTAFSTSRMEQLLETESPKLPWGATLIVITGIVSDALLATLLELRAAGRKVALVAVGAEVDREQLHGIPAYTVSRRPLADVGMWQVQEVEAQA